MSGGKRCGGGGWKRCGVVRSVVEGCEGKRCEGEWLEALWMGVKGSVVEKSGGKRCGGEWRDTKAEVEWRRLSGGNHCVGKWRKVLWRWMTGGKNSGDEGVERNNRIEVEEWRGK